MTQEINPQKRQKPKNRQELDLDIKNHPERGMLAGKLVVDLASAEYRGHVRRTTYSQVLDYGSPLAHRKSGIATIASFLFINSPVIRSGNRELLDPDYLADDGKEKFEYRCYLPLGTIAIFERLRQGLGLSKGEALTYALELMARSPALYEEYTYFVDDLATTHNVTPKVARGKVKGFWKRLGRDIRDETDDFESEKTIS